MRKARSFGVNLRRLKTALKIGVRSNRPRKRCAHSLVSIGKLKRDVVVKIAVNSEARRLRVFNLRLNGCNENLDAAVIRDGGHIRAIGTVPPVSKEIGRASC